MDFSERKNPEYDFLRKGSKAVGQCRRFTARKKNLNPKLEPLSKIVGLFTLTVESDANDVRC